jgi:hypothetical protein
MRAACAAPCPALCPGHSGRLRAHAACHRCPGPPLDAAAEKNSGFPLHPAKVTLYKGRNLYLGKELNSGMSETFIDYDAKVQDALRGVVRTILRETAEDGLAGDHHFYIAFKTQADGVDIPDHLKARFPEEMTIVLQHKFWGLKVEEDHFEVGLSFNQQPAQLRVPFGAIVGFVDPSVQFALQFHEESDDEEDDTAEELITDSTLAPARADDAKMADSDASGDVDDKGGTDDTDDTGDTGDAPAPGAANGDNVVTLDAFRKK